MSKFKIEKFKAQQTIIDEAVGKIKQKLGVVEAELTKRIDENRKRIAEMENSPKKKAKMDVRKKLKGLAETYKKKISSGEVTDIESRLAGNIPAKLAVSWSGERKVYRVLVL